MIEEIGGAGHAAAELADQVALAGPVAAQGAAESDRSTPTSRTESRRPDSRPGPMSQGSAMSLTLPATDPGGSPRRTPRCCQSLGPRAERGREIEAEAVDVADSRPNSAANPSPSAAPADATD